MSQNKKIWYFVEGESEKNFVLAMLRQHFPFVEICQTPNKFLDTQAQACYIHNSRSGDKIPFDIVDYGHFPQRANSKVIIVSDVEKTLNCPIERKQLVINLANQDAKHKNKNFDFAELVFTLSVPTIEEIYCFHKELTTKILKSKIHSDMEIDNKILENVERVPKTRVELLFKENKIRYDKVEFSEKFFPQLDYAVSKNPVVQRLFRMAQSVFSS